MTIPDISTANDPNLRASSLAMRRAAQLARKVAMQTNTDIVIVQNGQLVRIPASELRKHDTENETETTP